MNFNRIIKRKIVCPNTLFLSVEVGMFTSNNVNILQSVQKRKLSKNSGGFGYKYDKHDEIWGICAVMLLLFVLSPYIIALS